MGALGCMCRVALHAARRILHALDWGVEVWLPKNPPPPPILVCTDICFGARLYMLVRCFALPIGVSHGSTAAGPKCVLACTDDQRCMILQQRHASCFFFQLLPLYRDGIMKFLFSTLRIRGNHDSRMW